MTVGDDFGNQFYSMIHFLILVTYGSIFDKNNASSFSQYV